MFVLSCCKEGAYPTAWLFWLFWDRQVTLALVLAKICTWVKEPFLIKTLLKSGCFKKAFSMNRSSQKLNLFFQMNFQLYPASGNFSWCVLIPVGMRMTSRLGRWYHVLSRAFNPILLARTHVFPELIAVLFSLNAAHRGWFHCWWGKEYMRRSLQQRVSQLWDWSPQKQVEPQGFSGLCHLTKAALSKEAWGGSKCHTGLHPSPTKSVIVLGGSRIRAQRDLPHSLNVTSRVGALLSSQPFWGIIVGTERAGKTFPESVGGRKATLHAGNTSDVWKTLKCLLPEIKN